MAMDPLTAGLDLAKTAIDKIWPDTSAADAAKLDLLKQEIGNGFAAQIAQMKINEAEASNPSLFVAGWRPAAGWVGVVSLALVYIPKAVVLTGLWTYQAVIVVNAWHGSGDLTLPPYPDLGVTDILGLVGSMLGFGVLRSTEKIKGVA